MKPVYNGFDLSGFWSNSDYFTSPEPVTDEMVSAAEKKLGYKLPASYVALVKSKNGGSPENCCFPTKTPTSWADDHVPIKGIKGLAGMWGIDSEEFGNAQAIEYWGYPDIGIAVCECPSAGHDKVMLDYSDCGRQGEPRVIHVDVEVENTTFLADNFETFIRGLVNESVFDTAEED